jgi:hypothetical protein
MKKLLISLLLLLVLTFSASAENVSIRNTTTLDSGEVTLGIGDFFGVDSGWNHGGFGMRLAGAQVSSSNYMTLIFAVPLTHADKLYFIPSEQKEFTAERWGVRCYATIRKISYPNRTLAEPLRVTLYYTIVTSK